MTDEATADDVILATFIGEKPVVSRGGYVFQYFVPFAEADAARAVMGGAWQPDKPVHVGITRIREGAVVR